MEWGVVVSPDGLRFMSLADVYRAWIRFLYNVVEMENALYNDYSLKEHTLIAYDSPDSYPPVKLQFLLEVHDRFMLNYVEGSMGETLENLWAVTSGICTQKEDAHWIKEEVARIRATQEADTIRRLSDDLQKRIDDIVERQAGPDDPAVQLVKKYCAMLDSEDKRFLREVKMTLREGVKVFEAYERDAIRLGSEQLLAAIKQMPRVLESYHARVLSGALSIMLSGNE
jgi:hypothetical protein